ncbi:hypothetical protein VTK56DRAFT_3327 [Thermocarpiscus australiensis]
MPTSTITPTRQNPTYYEILNLSPAILSSHDDPSTLIKRAYRRALLSHHPDKKTHQHQQSSRNNSSSSSTTAFTIDQISVAYATLSRPSRRAAYDRSLQAQQNQTHPSSSSSSSSVDFQTGIETVDLDDLDCTYDQDRDGTTATTTWYRACRCGNPRGYLFGEADLEEAADLGELMVGCADCSLWLRVHFAVVVDDDGDCRGHVEGGVVGG